MKIEDLKASVSLREYVEANSLTDLTQYTTTSTYILYKNCPFCNHKEHFAIYIDSNRFCSFSNCVNLNNKSTGDIIDFIMLHNNVNKNEAINILNKFTGKFVNIKNKIGGNSNMNNNINNTLNKVEYIKKEYDFTNECINSIAIGTEGMTFFESRGLGSEIVQSYLLAYTPSMNEFLKDKKELINPKFYSADVYNIVIPNISVITDNNGSKNFVSSVMFRANNDKLNAINKENESKGSNFRLKKYKKINNDDSLFNDRYILKGELPKTFGLIEYADTETLYIVEGQFDALSIEQNQYHAMSLNSVNNNNKFIELVKNNLDKVKNFNFKLAFDNDNSGQTAANDVSLKLREMNLNCEIVTFNKKYHDINEFYIKNNDEFKVFLNENSSLYASKSFIDNEIDFLDNYLEEILTAKKDTCIKTGYAKLDAALGGGFFPGVYVLGATPGAGKTALANEICDNIARAGELTAMFSLELSKEEVYNRSLSSVSFRNALSLTKKFENIEDIKDISITINDLKRHYLLNRNISKVESLKKAVNTYKKEIIKNKIVVKQDIIGTSALTIRSKIQAIITKENRKPFVVVDYLQRLKNDDTSKDTMNAIAESMAILKQMSIEFKIPILVITSYNRASYMAAANLGQGKGSGDIEYTADCIISVQLKGQGEKEYTQEKLNEDMEKDIREIELIFLKNRNWKVGIKTEMSYIPAYNIMEEN